MNTLIGTYECKVDAKGRLMLPVAFKKQLTSVMGDGFVLKRAVFQPCLELYPMGEWNSLMLNINKLNRFKKKNNDFIRRFTSGVKPVDLDVSGRLLIIFRVCLHLHIVVRSTLVATATSVHAVR